MELLGFCSVAPPMSLYMVVTSSQHSKIFHRGRIRISHCIINPNPSNSFGRICNKLSHIARTCHSHACFHALSRTRLSYRSTVEFDPIDLLAAVDSLPGANFRIPHCKRQASEPFNRDHPCYDTCRVQSIHLSCNYQNIFLGGRNYH